MKHGLRLGAFVGIVWLCTACSPAAEVPTRERPSFVVILVDDMGYSDPGCFGGEINTPNIDKLAANGTRFTEFYNCSRCCQTRASLLTGAYPQRVGMAEFGRTLHAQAPTLAENLGDNGYQTAMVGKWHLSELPSNPNGEQRIHWLNHELDLELPFAAIDSYPTHRGFQHFYGVIWGVVNHFDPFSLVEGDSPVRSVPDNYYLTDTISVRSTQYIDDFAGSGKPFFLYVAYTAPHWPIQAPTDEIAKYRGRYATGWNALRRERFKRQQEIGLFDKQVPLGDISGPHRPWDRLPESERAFQAAKMEVHAAMVDRVDQGIGRIVDSLRETDQLDNTVIFFLSDNGASPEIPGSPGYDRYGRTRDGRAALREADLRLVQNRGKLGSDESYAGIGAAWASAVNTPLRFWKAESYEGGCRTPLVVHWPRGLKATNGGWLRDVGHVIDIAPTCLELAHARPRPNAICDGTSLVPALAGAHALDERTLYFAHGDGRGIRRASWKASKRANHAWQLFDVKEDPGETHDLAAANAEMLRSLLDEWKAWYETVFQRLAQ